MEKVVKLMSGAPSAPTRKDDDFVDRLSNRYTVLILVVFAVVVTAQTYVGNPITCWAPPHFTGGHVKYANSYCWVRNTYYVPFDENIPDPGEERKHVITYYQWIPFILLGQAILFYLPSVVWHAFNQKVGVDADNILETANSLTRTEKAENRNNVMKLVVNQFHRFLKAKVMKYYKDCHCDVKHIFTQLFRPCGTKFGNYLVLLFLLSKCLYIANVIGQLFLLNDVLSTKYSIFGFEILDYMSKGYDWTEAAGVAFPRVTFCDLQVRRLANVHDYTVQCTLPINMYNEKIYMFIWFWMIFVAVASILDIVVWILRFISKKDKIRFLTNHLTISKTIDPDDPRSLGEVDRFYENYLRQDGCFLLRLIGHNTNNITVTEITDALWERYQEWKIDQKNLRFQSDSEDESVPLNPTQDPVPNSHIDEGMEMTEKQKLAMV